MGHDSNLGFPGTWFLHLFTGYGRANLSEDLLGNASDTLKPLHFPGYTMI